MKRYSLVLILILSSVLNLCAAKNEKNTDVDRKINKTIKIYIKKLTKIKVKNNKITKNSKNILKLLKLNTTDIRKMSKYKLISYKSLFSTILKNNTNIINSKKKVIKIIIENINKCLEKSLVSNTGLYNEYNYKSIKINDTIKSEIELNKNNDDYFFYDISL